MVGLSAIELIRFHYFTCFKQKLPKVFNCNASDVIESYLVLLKYVFQWTISRKSNTKNGHMSIYTGLKTWIPVWAAKRQNVTCSFSKSDVVESDQAFFISNLFRTMAAQNTIIT